MFKSTKLKLTAWYLAILMTITISFSSIVYYGVVRTAQRALISQRVRVEHEFETFVEYRTIRKPFTAFDEETLKEISKRTLNFLILVNLVILVTAGSLAYILSGITLRPIEEMIKKQKRFVSDAAHEMKTPLTAMKTNLEVTLRDKNLDIESSKKALKETVEDVDKLAMFTTRLLEQSKYQNGNPIEMTDVDLDKILDSVIKKLKPTANEQKQSINTTLVQTKVRGYKHALTELFTNLIDNAIKYNKQGENIDISMSVENHIVEVTIKDNGTGIKQEDMPFIFEPFYRGDKSRSKIKADGYGLGLAISKEIVDKHNGTIKVQSSQDTGTTVIVRLNELH